MSADRDGHAFIFNIFFMKNAVSCNLYYVNFTFSLGVGILIDRPSTDVDYISSENGLKITFGTTLQNRKPQRPSSVDCRETFPQCLA